MENVQRNFLGGFSIHGDPGDQCKNDSVRLPEQGTQRKLVTAGDSSD